MSDEKVYPVRADFAATAHIRESAYREMYRRSLDDPDGFWAEQATKFLTWVKPWTKVLDYSFDPDKLHIQWFIGGKLNVAWNCLDRHLEKRGDQVAIIWEGDDPGAQKEITYRELHGEVSRFANALKARGVKMGTGSASISP